MWGDLLGQQIEFPETFLSVKQKRETLFFTLCNLQACNHVVLQPSLDFGCFATHSASVFTIDPLDTSSQATSRHNTPECALKKNMVAELRPVTFATFDSSPSGSCRCRLSTSPITPGLVKAPWLVKLTSSSQAPPFFVYSPLNTAS